MCFAFSYAQKTRDKTALCLARADRKTNIPDNIGQKEER